MLEHNLNQQILLFNFVLLTLHTRKVNFGEIFFYLLLNLTQPYQMSGSWFFLSISFIEILFASMCSGKNYMMQVFCK